MLYPWIIEEIKKRERKERKERDRPTIQPEVDDRPPKDDPDPKPEEESPDDGKHVIIIDPDGPDSDPGYHW